MFDDGSQKCHSFVIAVLFKGCGGRWQSVNLGELYFQGQVKSSELAHATLLHLLVVTMLERPLRCR